MATSRFLALFHRTDTTTSIKLVLGVKRLLPGPGKEVNLLKGSTKPARIRHGQGGSTTAHGPGSRDCYYLSPSGNSAQPNTILKPERRAISGEVQMTA